MKSADAIATSFEETDDDDDVDDDDWDTGMPDDDVDDDEVRNSFNK